MSHALAAVVCRRQAILGDRMPATHLPHEHTILGSLEMKLGLLADSRSARGRIQNCPAELERHGAIHGHDQAYPRLKHSGGH